VEVVAMAEIAEQEEEILVHLVEITNNKLGRSWEHKQR